MSKSDTTVISAPVAVVAPGDLGQLAAEIRFAYAGFEASWSDALTRAIALGSMLVQAKTQLRHGEWLPFLDACQVSSQAASVFIRVARAAEADELPLNSNAERSLSLRKAAALVATGRKRGELPEASLGVRVATSALGALLGKSPDQRTGGSICDYLERLVTAMVDGWGENWPEEEAEAARLVGTAVGRDKAAELGSELVEQAVFFGRLGQALQAVGRKARS